MSVERRIAYFAELSYRIRALAVKPTLVNIFGGGNGNVDIEAVAAEICSKYGANREDIF